jgi:calcineurin-like phosphoesterase family protein
MTKYWVISDTHWYHKNIIAYCGRPTDCDDRMWKNIQVVGPDDVLIHLGDVALVNPSHAQNIVDRLPGFCKILVQGNHDKRSRIHKCSWDLVIPPPDQPYVIDDWCEVPIYLTHRLPEKYPEYGILIHGHIHEKGVPVHWRGRLMVINTSVEQHNYCPISLSSIIAEWRDHEVRDL